MNCKFLFSAATAVLTAFGSPARATTLEVTKGEVLLRHGQGFAPVRGSADLSVGDTIVGRPGSAAKITFTDGCTIFLGTGMVFQVNGQSPCSGNPIETGSAKTPGEGTAAVETVGNNWNAATETVVAANEAGPNFIPYMLGAAAIVGGVAAVTALGGGDNGPPASP